MFNKNIVKRLSGAIDKASEIAENKVKQVKTATGKITKDFSGYTESGRRFLTENTRCITNKALDKASDGLDFIVKSAKEGSEKGKEIIDKVIKYLTLNIINRIVSLACRTAFKYQIQKAKKHNAVNVGIFDNKQMPVKSLTIEAESIAPEIRYNQWYYIN